MTNLASQAQPIATTPEKVLSTSVLVIPGPQGIPILVLNPGVTLHKGTSVAIIESDISLVSFESISCGNVAGALYIPGQYIFLEQDFQIHLRCVFD